MIKIMFDETEQRKETSGLVPAPKTGENKKFLRADGTWADVEMEQIGAESITEEEIDNLFTE